MNHVFDKQLHGDIKEAPQELSVNRSRGVFVTHAEEYSNTINLKVVYFTLHGEPPLPRQCSRAPTWFLRIHICIFLAVIAGIGGMHLGQLLSPDGQTAISNAPSLLTVPSSALSIGEVWENGAFEWVLPIQNHSDNELEIKHFSTSCNCLFVRPSRLCIPGGGTRDIRLLLDFRSQDTPKLNHGASKQVQSREFSVTVKPNVDYQGPHGIQEWTVKAKVRSAILLDTPTLVFVGTSRLAQPLAPKTVKVTDLVGLDGLTA